MSTTQSIICNRFNATKGFFAKYVTMDKIWIHYFTLESNWQSTEWTAAGKNHPKWLKTQTSADKVLVSVFWDAPGILFIDYVKNGRTFNSEYYIALLVHLKKETAKKQPKLKKNVLFHQDNVQCHKSIAKMAKLNELHFELLPHPPYSPELLAVYRPQKNAPGKEIWLQWRSDIRKWGVFWGQRQIVQQKRHWIVREALESVYHPKKRLCWWIKLNFA